MTTKAYLRISNNFSSVLCESHGWPWKQVGWGHLVELRSRWFKPPNSYPINNGLIPENTESLALALSLLASTPLFKLSVNFYPFSINAWIRLCWSIRVEVEVHVAAWRAASKFYVCHDNVKMADRQTDRHQTDALCLLLWVVQRDDCHLIGLIWYYRLEASSRRRTGE